MKRAFLFGFFCASAWALASSTARAASEARVTQVVRDVKLLQENAQLPTKRPTRARPTPTPPIR